MTSFAFVAGLIPLVVATGPGAVGNRTIGASALGGMLFGTVFGVIVVPGLYYITGKMAEGRKLIQDENLNPLSEDYVESYSEVAFVKKIKRLLTRSKTKNGKQNNS
jgi:HAE1 family hydrophobic/amphiphilic exporter-1